MSVDYRPDYDPADVDSDYGHTGGDITVPTFTANMKPFRFWCQKALPLVYDDSLSYYEVLCKVVKQMNDFLTDLQTATGAIDEFAQQFVINQQFLNDMADQLGQNVQDLEEYINDRLEDYMTAYTQLQDYVNNYFDNLDVQQEINNKLDEMASDGTFNTLFDPVITAWMTTKTAQIDAAIAAQDAVQAQQNGRISTLESRMDTFASLPSGSTSGNAELLDIRTNFLGETYPTAGDAVRASDMIASGFQSIPATLISDWDGNDESSVYDTIQIDISAYKGGHIVVIGTFLYFQYDIQEIGKCSVYATNISGATEDTNAVNYAPGSAVFKSLTQITTAIQDEERLLLQFAIPDDYSYQYLKIGHVDHTPNPAYYTDPLYIVYGNSWSKTPVDDTLSIPGDAADAKATGDALEQLNERFVYGCPLALQWEQGRLSTQGAEVASDYICRTKLMPVSAGSILQVVQSASHSVDVYFYNGSTFVERVASGGGTQAKIGTRFYTVPNGVDGFRVICPLDGVTPLTPDVAAKMVFIAVTDRAFISILRGAENGVHRYAKLKSFGNSILTGTVYLNGSIGAVVSYDNAPYGGVAIGLGLEQHNVDHTLLSSTGLLYDAGKGSFLSNIKQTDITGYDYLLTHFWTDDMSNYQLGDIETAVANDGTLIGGVLELLSYVRTNNKLCSVILVSVPPVGISSAGDGIFDAVYANGKSIKDLDYVMHELADRYHFTYIDWQDMYLSYHYQEYTYQSNNVHLATSAPYRTMSEYLSQKVRYSIGKTKEVVWENGVSVGEVWESGRVNTTTGELITTTTAIRTNKIPISEISELYIVGTLNYTGSVFYYSGSTFISYAPVHSLPSPFTIPSGADTCIVVIRNIDGSVIDTIAGANVKIYDSNGAVIKAVLSEGKQQNRMAMLTIIDDDSNERFYNDLYPVMRNKKVTVATAVITGSVGNTGNMSWSEIEECYSNGIEVLSHTHSHFLSTDPDFDSLTIKDITIDYQKAKNILALHGMPTDILVFSGSTGLTSKFQTAAERVYRYGILAGDNKTNYQGGDPYRIRRYRVGNQTDNHCDIETLQGLIDSVKTTGGWMIWMTHTSGGSSAWTSGTGEGSSAYILGQAVDYAISQGVPVVSTAYGIKKYFSKWENTNVEPYS